VTVHRNLEIEITKLAFGGEGIGVVEGKTCFVEGALPGETVIAKVLQDKKNFMRARTLRVLTASPGRVVPPCVYVDMCGGCQYQHVAYADELRMKEAQVREAVMRGLGLPGDVVRAIRRGSKEYRYRNSVTLHPTQKEGPQTLGFVARDNRTRLAVADCLLVDERLTPVFRTRFRPKKGADRLSFKLGDKGEIVTDQEESYVRIQVGGRSLLASSRGFFQNNLEVTGLIAAEVARWTAETRPDRFFDLFAGVGTFTFLAAREVPNVFCVEESPESLKALRMNRSEQGMNAVEIVEGRVEKAFPLVFEREKKGRVMLCLDPPRGGLERDLAEFIGAKAGVAGIAYVSCDLATLVRDLRILLANDRYEVREIVPFDMFPRTKHVEIAVYLAGRNPSDGPA